MSSTKKTHKSRKKSQPTNRLGRLPMAGTAVDDALRGAMEIAPPDDTKPQTRKSKKKTVKKTVKKKRKK